MKKATKNVAGFITTAVALGAGAQIVTASGGNAGGLSNMASMMPAMGTIQGGGMVLNELKKIGKK